MVGSWLFNCAAGGFGRIVDWFYARDCFAETGNDRLTPSKRLDNGERGQCGGDKFLKRNTGKAFLAGLPPRRLTTHA